MRSLFDWIARTRALHAVAIVGAVVLLSTGRFAISPALGVGAGYSAVYDDKADCGAAKSNTYTSVGYAIFSRAGDTLTIEYHLIGAQANTTYYVELWTNPGCSNYADMGTIGTDASGDGSLITDTGVGGYSKFFLYAHDSGFTTQNETRTKSLH